MEISPIPGIRALQAMKTPPQDPKLSEVFGIESVPGPGDDSYSGSGKHSAGGQDDEADDPRATAGIESPEESAVPSINFFA